MGIWLLIAGLTVGTAAHAGLLSRVLNGGFVPNWTLGGEPVRLIEVPTATPFGTGACPGVRPGAIVKSDKGQCTFNFVFTGSDRETYIGTAGHCILGDSAIGGDAGEMIWGPEDGPLASNGRGERIGRFVYAILQDPKDFALILVDRGVTADPQMCHFGGPTGVNSESGAVVLHYYGNGVGVGSVLPARTGFARCMPPDHVFAQALAVPGDSGSGIISDDGRAVGVIVTVGIQFASICPEGEDPGIVGITRLAPQVARAAHVLGVALTLKVARTL
ncbi:MAG: hypothetical protein ACREVY_02660 [Gammaproteobacteria bacterium]